MDASVSSFATMEMTNGNAKMNTVKGFIIDIYDDDDDDDDDCV